MFKMDWSGKDWRLVGSNENLNWVSCYGNKEKGMDGRNILEVEFIRLVIDWIWERNYCSVKSGWF